MSARIVAFPRARHCPSGNVHIYPDDFDGGCWALEHVSHSGDHGTLLGRYFSFDDALVAGRQWAADLGAEFAEDSGGGPAA